MELNCRDYKQFPPVNRKCLKLLRKECGNDKSAVHAAGFVRKGKNGEPFVDLYIWDFRREPECRSRFLICRDGCLSRAEEERFLKYARDDDLSMNYKNYWDMCTEIEKQFPEWKIPQKRLLQFGELLEHIYFISHRSGCREILYKADLDLIAYHLDKIPGHDPQGSNPTGIVGHHLPVRLLRILNTEEMISRLYEEDSIEECAAVYRKYASYLGEKLPSGGQWEYLTELYRHGGAWWGMAFSRSIYRQIGELHGRFGYELYEEFFDLKEKVGGGLAGSISEIDDVLSGISRFKRILELRECEEEWEPKIRKRKCRNAEMEFSNEQYSVRLPESCADFYKEATEQGNCLLEYLALHGAGETTILFVRKNAEPKKPFVSIEIDRDGRIRQAYGKYNSHPEPDVCEFLKTYAAEKGFQYEMRIQDAGLIGRNVWFEQELRRRRRWYRRRNIDLYIRGRIG